MQIIGMFTSKCFKMSEKMSAKTLKIKANQYISIRFINILSIGTFEKCKHL